MAKLYKVIVNAKGTEAKEVKVLQGASEKGDPVHIAATRDMRLELQDVAKGSNLAPDQVRLKRMGKNLWLYFDGSEVADVVLDDYYNNDSDAKGEPPVLAGYAENGEVYEYIPQDPEVSSLSGALKEGNVPVIMSLGGGGLGGFELSALPLVAAAGGGISGLLLGGAALAAAAAGGGKGGGAAAPSGQTGHLTHDATNDTGASATDSYTNKTTPQLTINAEHGATVVVTVNGKDYPATETATSGVYTVDVGSKETAGKLTDGVYTPIIKVTNSAGTSSANGEAFTVDSSTSDNQDGAKTPTDQKDSNYSAAVKINIGTIDDGLSTTASATGSKDTGSSNTDFVTSDGTLTFKGTVTGFVANGDLVHVQVLDSAGKAVLDQYVAPDSSGAWSINNQSKTLANGTYTINATIEDLAGNVVKTDTHSLTVEAATPNPLPLPSPDTGATLGITSITNDTGTSPSDFKTSDNKLTIHGTTTLSNGSAVQVYVEVLQGTTVVRKGYATLEKDTNHPMWTFEADNDSGVSYLADGSYTISAVFSSLAGNALGTAVKHDLLIASDGNPLSLTVLPDTNMVTEGNSVNGNVLTNDSTTAATATLKVATVGGSAANVSTTGAVKHIAGLYGQLDLFENGDYTYTPDGHLAAGVQQTDTFNYTASAGNVSKGASLAIAVTGVDDAAVITPIGAQVLTHVATLVKGGTLAITDLDPSSSLFVGISNSNAGNNLIGHFGALVLTANTVDTYSSTYNWKYENTNANSTQYTQHDLYTLVSTDGSATTTLDFSKQSSAANTAQSHDVWGHTSAVDTFNVVANSNNASGINLNLTSVEKVNASNGSADKLVLNLTSLTQADAASGSTHRLYINGDTSDSIDFSGVTSAVTYSLDTATRVVDNITYHVHHIGNDELLVQTTIANISVHS